MTAQPWPPLYLDQAATSFPKCPQVADAIAHYLTQQGGSPGRSVHRYAQQADELLFDLRALAAKTFGLRNPMRVVVTPSATTGLNQAIHGLLQVGDHVITTSFEHNSTIRPLQQLADRKVIELTIAQVGCQRQLTPKLFESLLQPNTRALVVNHASNVTGTAVDLLALAKFARERGLITIIDAAQSAGNLAIDVDGVGLDMVVVAGHKALGGPQGIGLLLLGSDFDESQLTPLWQGGTGSASSSISQPSFLPDMLESGTPNMLGVAGLAAALRQLNPRRLSHVRQHKASLVAYFARLAQSRPWLQLAQDWRQVVTGTLAFALQGISPVLVGAELDRHYDIACRVGLHCAPLAHQSLGSYPDGLVRIAFGEQHQRDDVDRLVQALQLIWSQHG